MATIRFQMIFLLLTILLIISCRDQSFTKAENAAFAPQKLDTSNCIRITSYSLTFNPKSNGFIYLELENGSKYQAKSVDGGSFSSINSLLKEQAVLFDTLRKEVVIKKYLK